MWSRGDGRMVPAVVLVEVVETLVVRTLVGTVAMLAAETATRGGGGYDHKGGDVTEGPESVEVLSTEMAEVTGGDGNGC